MALLLRHVRSSRVVFVLAALVLGGGALIAATGATADPAVSTTIPFTFGGTNLCAGGEPFQGTGNLHSVISGNLSNGDTAQSHLEANLQGLQAVTVLGKKYVVPESFSQTFVLDFLDAQPFHETLEFVVQFIRQGEDGSFVTGDDFYEHFLAHVTVNANGILTVDDFRDDMRCQ